MICFFVYFFLVQLRNLVLTVVFDEFSGTFAKVVTCAFIGRACCFHCGQVWER